MKGLFELAYFLGYKFDRRRKSAAARSLPGARVISVGNLTTGGTGKTSLVIALAGRLSEGGRKISVLTRGYKGRLKGPARITPSLSAADAGDEPLLMAAALPGVPVIKGADRYGAGLHALGLVPKPELFILDDGFQHWRLKRDLDILVLSANDPFYSGRLLPVGNLREPASEMGRADIIVVSKTRDVPPDFEREIRKYNPNAPVFAAWYEAEAVANPEKGKRYPPRWLQGKEVLAFSGIGEPSSFRQSLIEAGAVIREFLEFPDHHAFRSGQIECIRKKARGLSIITTEKDIMRLGSGSAGVYALCVRMRAAEGFFAEVISRIKGKGLGQRKRELP